MILSMLFRDFDSKIVSEAKILCERGFSVELIGPDSAAYRTALRTLPKAIHSKVIPIKRKPLPVIDLRLILKQINIAIRTRSKICHCFGMNEVLPALFLKALNRTIIYEVLDDAPSILATIIGLNLGSRLLGDFFEKILRTFETICCGQFDYIIALTDFLSWDRSRYNKRRVTIGYYPDPCFNPSNVDASLVAKYQASNVVVYDGRIVPEKGIDIMLDVAKFLRPRIPNFKLLLIGGFLDTHVRKDFLRRVSELALEDHVDITGWVPLTDVPKYINAGKIGLSLLKDWCYSYAITEPYKVLEVMSCGKPIIAAGGSIMTKRLIEQSGGGVFVKRFEATAVAHAVADLLRNDNKREELGLNCRKFMSNNRKWSDFETKLLSVYDRVQSGNSVLTSASPSCQVLHCKSL